MMTRGPMLGQVRLAPNYRLSGKEFLGSLPSLTDSTFSQALSAPKAVIKLWSPACHYCTEYAPTFESVGARHAGDVLMATVEVEDAPEIAKKYGISSLPATVFLVNGKEVNKIEGVMDEKDLEAEVSRAFGGATSNMVPVSSEKPSSFPILPVVGVLGAIGLAIFLLR